LEISTPACTDLGSFSNFCFFRDPPALFTLSNVEGSAVEGPALPALLARPAVSEAEPSSVEGFTLSNVEGPARSVFLEGEPPGEPHPTASPISKNNYHIVQPISHPDTVVKYKIA
jgi:hypothetical protein